MDINDYLLKIKEEGDKTKVTETDIQNESFTDEYGVIYSKDGKRLLKVNVPNTLKEYSIKEGTEIICDSSFEGCSELQSLIIPTTVKSIGSHVFEWCRNLSTLNIPSSVTWIAPEFLKSNEPEFRLMSFQNFCGVKEINIEGNNYEIRDNLLIDNHLYRVVYAIHSKKHQEIPEGILIIDSGAFNTHTVNESVTLPQSLKYIGEEAFHMSRITSLDLPEALVYIGERAFEYCDFLTSVQFPKDLKVIPEKSFSGCQNLKNITFPENLESIEDQAFQGCPIEIIKIPQSLKSLGNDVFTNPKISEVIFKGIPDIIGTGNFHSYSNDIKIIIPDGTRYFFDRWLNEYDYRIFYACELEGNYEVEEGVRDEEGIVYSKDGSKLLYVSHPIIKKGLNIENRRCPSDYKIKEGTKIICKDAFSGCKELKRISLPPSVKYIAESTFDNCENLEAIEFSEGILSIGPSAFKDCKSIITLKFPDSLTTIHEKAFMRCNNLENINFGRNVCYIGNAGFAMCTPGLKAVEFPNQLIMVNNYTFHECTKLKHVHFNNKLIDIDKDAFSACLELENIKLPESLLRIGEKAFRRCLNIKEVTIPDRVKDVWDYAFSECESLEKVFIPQSVEYVSKTAFSYCYNLKEVIIDNPNYIWDGTEIVETNN